jgi:hypothetical protein
MDGVYKLWLRIIENTLNRRVWTHGKPEMPLSLCPSWQTAFKRRIQYGQVLDVAQINRAYILERPSFRLLQFTVGYSVPYQKTENLTV